jgi:biopolymer transport protein ExbD
VRLTRFRTEEEDTPWASMADLAFNLVIFMMVMMISGAMADQGIEVFLPSSEARSEFPPRQVMITIDRVGRVFLDGKPGSLAEVKGYVTSRITNKPGEFVVIKSDRDTPYKFVIDVMDELTQAGITRIALPTRQEGEGGGG